MKNRGDACVVSLRNTRLSSWDWASLGSLAPSARLAVRQKTNPPVHVVVGFYAACLLSVYGSNETLIPTSIVSAVYVSIVY